MMSGCIQDKQIHQIPYLGVDILKAMLIREHELRTSIETQKIYSEAEKSEATDWMEVTDQLQRRVIKEFGIEDEELGLYSLRTAAIAYPDVQDFKEIPLYVKYNRAKNGFLKCGDEAPNVNIVKMDQSCGSLLDYSNIGRPLVVIAGSYS